MSFLQFVMPVLLYLSGQSLPDVPPWLQDLKPIQGEFTVRRQHPRLYLTHDREVNFLHALQVFPREPDRSPSATLVKGQGATGAALPGWTVLLAADKGGEQPIVYGAGAPGLHLIIGLQPDRFVTIEADRRRIARVRTTEAGTAIFPWRMRREALVSVSYK